MLLRVVAFVLRYQPFIATPTVLGHEISSFLGPSFNLSLSEASKYTSTALLDWIWESSCKFITERPSTWSLANFLQSDVHYCRWQFSKTLTVAASRGNLVIVDWVFKHFKGCVVTVAIVELIAGNGHLELLQYMLEHDAGRQYRQRRVPIDDDNELYQSIPKLPPHWDGPGNCVCWGGRSMLRAIKNCHLDVARWMFENIPHEHNEDEINAVVRAALEAGAVEFAESLLPAGRSIFDYAEGCFHPNVIEMKLTSGIQISQRAVSRAVYTLAIAGRLDLMKRVYELYRPPLPTDSAWLYCWRITTYGAVRRDDFPMLQWLTGHGLEEKFNGSLDFGVLAASGGNLRILKYLNEKGIADEFEDELLHAVRSGHLDAVKWLLPYATNLTKLQEHNLMNEAATFGHLSILQFFHSIISCTAG